MPKDGYVCAVAFGMAPRAAMNRHRRTVFRRAWRRWQGRVRLSTGASWKVTLRWGAERRVDNLTPCPLLRDFDLAGIRVFEYKKAGGRDLSRQP